MVYLVTKLPKITVNTKLSRNFMHPDIRFSIISYMI